MLHRIERVRIIPALAAMLLVAFIAAQPWLPGWPAYVVAGLVAVGIVLLASRRASEVTSAVAGELRRDSPIVRDHTQVETRYDAEPRMAAGSGIGALYDVSLRSGLRQAAMATEKAAELADECTSRFLALAHSLSVRGQELLERPSEDRTAKNRREPYGLREDIAATARGLGFELGREVALRFSQSFPAQALADRVVIRLGLSALILEAAERAPDAAELLVEASHEELEGANVNVRIAVSGTGRATIGDLPRYRPSSRERDPVAGLAEILARDGGHVNANAACTELAFSFATVRYKRVTGTTLYGLGSLSERKVLVFDPRAIGRVTICEQLAAWRLSPTGVTSIAEAQALAERMEPSSERFDLIVVSGFALDQAPEIAAIVSHLPAFKCRKVVSLEELDSACLPLAESLVAVAGLELRRAPRPPSPNDLITLLTELLVAKPEMPRDPARRGHGLSLVLAEDNNVNQALLVKMLERHGHTVVVTNNGADLVDCLSEQPGAYDAVLMDIQMPVMDGYEAAAVIRLREAQGHRARIPIIAVTAHAMGGERERCFEAGMDGYLAKPIDDKELSLTLETLVMQARSFTSAPAPKRADDIFDRERVLELAAGDTEFLRGLAEMFGESAPKLVATIAQALARGDGEAAYRAGHQLKGSIGNFGADKARLGAAAVEELARRGELNEAAALVPQLEIDVDELVASLRALAQE